MMAFPPSLAPPLLASAVAFAPLFLYELLTTAAPHAEGKINQFVIMVNLKGAHNDLCGGVVV